MITKPSDLIHGKTYCVAYSRTGRTRKGIFIACINEKESYPELFSTELLWAEILPKRKHIKLYGRKARFIVHQPYFQEIGIGETPKEARANYGKFRYEHNEKFCTHENQAHKMFDEFELPK